MGLLSDHHNISSVGVGEKWGPIADYDIGLRSERSRCVEEGRGQILTVISTNASIEEVMGACSLRPRGPYMPWSEQGNTERGVQLDQRR